MALSRGDYSAAVQHSSQLVKAAPDSYEGWVNLGLAYQKTGRLEQAGNAYREATRLRPDAPEPNANLGAVLQEKGDLVGARRAHEKALAGAPDTPGVLWNLALLAEREGNAQEAEQLLEKLLAVKADWEDAAFRLGFLQLQRGEFASAVDSFEICLKKRRDWVEALLNLGLAFWKFEDLEGADQTFNRVLALQPGNTDALRALTAIAIERKNPKVAWELHQKAAALGGRSPELSFNLGLLLQSTGDEAAAVQRARLNFIPRTAAARTSAQAAAWSRLSKTGGLSSWRSRL